MSARPAGVTFFFKQHEIERANMPGAVARTSTFALNTASLPFVLEVANLGWRRALAGNPHLRSGLNVHEGQIACAPVAAAHGAPYVPAEALLAA